MGPEAGASHVKPTGNYPLNLAIGLARIAHGMGLTDEVKRLMAMCHPHTLDETNEYNKARVELGLVK